MERTAQISKEKQQSIIILRHKSMWKVSQSRKLRTFKVSSNAVAKTIKGYDETNLMRTATGKTQSYFCCRG
jgi:hypothetical protein